MSYRVLLLIALQALAACAGRESRSERPVDREVTVQATNHHWADIVLYAVRSGQRLRLGEVTSMAERSFVLPSTATVGSTDLQLLVDPIGGRTVWRSASIVVQPGQWIRLDLENDLNLSTVSVW